MSRARLMLALSIAVLVAAIYRRREELGVTLVDLLAYVGDQLSYAQDAVASEAYLETARPRDSLRRHAQLVDYEPKAGAEE